MFLTRNTSPVFVNMARKWKALDQWYQGNNPVKLMADQVGTVKNDVRNPEPDRTIGSTVGRGRGRVATGVRWSLVRTTREILARMIDEVITKIGSFGASGGKRNKE